VLGVVFLIIDKIHNLSIMRNTMPAKSPEITNTTAENLAAIGAQIRAQRKALRISATVAAEAAGMSRITLHRIEGGEPSVTMGAYLNVLAALGMAFGVIPPAAPAAQVADEARRGWLPARVRLADYPQLKQLAWQVHGTDELTPQEALGIYERNWRHMDLSALTAHEQDLINTLRQVLGEVRQDA
jgi:transcriptional regulator with XRE-family HTH domain